MAVMLCDLGFFELLNTPGFKELPNFHGPDIKFIKYKTETIVQTNSCAELLDALSDLVGRIPAETFVYDGLVEAINNVKHHAYLESGHWYGVPDGTWIMCGAYSKSSGSLTAAVYDMGAGIPATLPRSSLWERIREYVPFVSDDAEMIAAAMEAGRSRTESEERGKGLPIMMRLFNHCTGQLRILSGRGEVIFDGRSGQYIKKKHKLSLGGTLIQFEIQREND